MEFDRATLADWIASVVFLLSPLAEAIARHVCAGATMYADDAPVPMLSPGLGKTKTGPCGAVLHRSV